MIDYLEEILNLCDEFVNYIDNFELGIAEDFYCFPNTKEIFITTITLEQNIKDFMKSLYRLTDIRDISDFTWSLLHEVGHCMTYPYLNKRTKNHCRNIKKKISKGKIQKSEYYTLSDEKSATLWAIRFVGAHHLEVKEFDDALLKLLKQYYQKWGSI